MYEYLKGTLAEKNPAYAVVDCQGVGYIVQISLFTYSALPETGSAAAPQVKLLVHQLVREDSHMLFGFASEHERELFRLLISVTGVGANTARMLLSSLDPAQLTEAILGGNTALLSSVKGIGAKTAARIILDLKDKVGKSTVPAGLLISPHNTLREEALSALSMLGFQRAAAEKALYKVLQDNGLSQSLETVIKAALKLL